MIAIETIIAFVIFCFALTASPGPSSLFITSVSLQYGFKKSLNTIYGEVLGWAIYLLPVVFGLGAFIQNNSELLMYIKYAGGVYLLYLAYQALVSKEGAYLQLDGEESISNLQLFKKGFFVSISNPKVVIYYIAFLPQFIEPNGHEMSQLIILCAIDYFIGFTVYGFYAYATDKIKTLLSAGFIDKYVPKVSAAIYTLVALLVIFE